MCSFSFDDTKEDVCEMIANPLVSILLPAYNASLYIEEAIQSILQQTYPRWELLICDDASTDNTYAIIEKFLEADSRVSAYRNDVNSRLLKTRNRLLALAKGSLITFQDADDYSDRSRLEKMVREFDRNPRLGLVCSQVGYVNASGSLLRVSNRPTDYRTVLESIFEHNVVGGSMMMITREALDSVGGGFRTYFDGLSYQDYDLSFLIAQKYECYNLPDVLYYYRQHDKSASKMISVERLLAKEVVIHLARQRKLRGCDDIQLGHPEKVDVFFENLKDPYRQDRSLIFRDYAADFMFNKLYKAAILAAFKAIAAEPGRMLNYRTLFYCIRKTLMR